MYELLKLTFDICLFKKGPQDMPASYLLMKLLIVAYIGTSVLILALSVDLLNAVLQALTEVSLMLGLSWLILFFSSRSARFLQATNALIATDTLISLFALPAMATLVSQQSGLAFFSMIALMLWHGGICAHIFSHTLEKSFSFSLGIAVLYILTSYTVIDALFFIET